MSGQRFEAGQFITFAYHPPVKPPKTQYKYQVDPLTKRQTRITVPAPPEPPSDPNKSIMVLHPNWHQKVHAVDLARVSPAEQQVLRAVMDPATKQAIDGGQWPIQGVPPYPLIRDILRRYDPNDLIKNPLSFYQLLIKPFIRGKDCYRQYFPQFMSGVKVVQESTAHGPVMHNVKPLFHK